MRLRACFCRCSHIVSFPGYGCSSGRYSHLEEDEAEWKLSRKPVACGQYSHLEELVGHLEAGLDSSYCWIECLPLELLRKVFLHLSTDDLKVRF